MSCLLWHEWFTVNSLLAFKNLLQASKDLVDFSLGVQPPVGGPNSVDTPTQAFQHVLPQTVSVAGRCAGVVRTTVALDADEISARCSGVNYTKVDSVA